MRAVIQRVSRAQVSAGEDVVGRIGPGLLVLLGVGKTDTQSDADYLVAKIVGLRIFEDENGKMNLSLQETRGAVLAVSSSLSTVTCARASGRRSTRRHLPNWRMSCTSTW